jgi:hypothetical protein
MTKSDEHLVVTIIDSLDARLDGMAAAFEGLASPQLVDGTGRITDAAGMQVTDYCEPLLTLCHLGDIDSPVRSRTDPGQAKTVYYGGDYPANTRLPSGWKYMVRRPVLGKETWVTSTEARELLAFFQRPEPDRTEDNAPACLKPPLGTDLLSALAILCQGYVAVFTDPSSSEPDVGDDAAAREACREALKRMEWQSLVHNREACVRALRPELWQASAREKLQVEVSDSAWWEVFEPDDVEHRCRQEWGEGDPDGLDQVLKLLRAVREKHQVTPLVVCKAFCAIASRLGISGRGQDGG